MPRLHSGSASKKHSFPRFNPPAVPVCRCGAKMEPVELELPRFVIQSNGLDGRTHNKRKMWRCTVCKFWRTPNEA
jgi:hypothetical protein